MAELKTKPGGDVMAFLETIKEEARKKDCITLLKLMKQITKEEPTLWGGRIIGFGKYHYKSERSKQEGDWFITGFSSNKQNLTVYIIAGFEKYDTLMKKLGKHKTGVSCLYLNKLSDVDGKVLKELISTAYQWMKGRVKEKK